MDRVHDEPRPRALKSGQILVTLGDTEERRRYLNARSTIDKLLEELGEDE